MAEIVLGMASPHAFGGGDPLQMEANRQKDSSDRRMNYAALLEQAKVERPWLADEVTDEKMQSRYDQAMVGLGALAELLQRTAPDVLVVVGDDQYEQFQDGNMPMFCIFHGDTLPSRRVRGGGKRTGSGAWSSPLWDQLHREEGEKSYAPEQPGAAKLGHHLIEHMVDEEFDVARCKQMNPEVGLGHAFTFVYERLLPQGGVPMLPVMVNTFFKPNTPRPARAFKFGQALRRGIESWDSDARVAVLASGGLSHTYVDEEMDHAVLDGIVERNPSQLSSLPAERLRNGTSELLNWIAVAGMLEGRDFTFLLDYIPSYRTEAGTGNGLAIGYWE